MNISAVSFPGQAARGVLSALARREEAHLTTEILSKQWTNPTDISTILMVIGGDVVQKAFAQGTGKPFVPVCFSFGCVAYAFIGLVNIIGDGRLLPPPDYPCRVLNLNSGYIRENKNFVVGRLLRDLESRQERRDVLSDGTTDDGETRPDKDTADYSLRITVYEANYNDNSPTRFNWGYIHVVGLLVMIIQIFIAAIPMFADRDRWTILLITLAGTAFTQVTGLIPQWKAEKLPARQKSREVYALTSGNGSREIVVIFGYGNSLDLESMAVPQPPRNSRLWEKFAWLSEARDKTASKVPLDRQNSWRRKALVSPIWPYRGVPWGFVITHVTHTVLPVLWLLLLVNVSAPKLFPESWCLLAVGGLGMFQNGWLAAKELSSGMRNLPLRRIDSIRGRKVMDAIMDFHTTYGLGTPLRDEYFPGKLRPAEDKWWAGDCGEYDIDRRRQSYRGTPRGDLPDEFPPYVYSMRRIRDVSYRVSPRSPPRSTRPTLTEDLGKSSRFYGIAAEDIATIGRVERRDTVRAVLGEEAGGGTGGGSKAMKSGEEPDHFSFRAAFQVRTDSMKAAAWAA
jgi:hypothetical protein